MANYTIQQTVDLRNPARVVVFPDALMVPGDDKGHVLEITVMNGGAAADLSGYTAVGYFERVGGTIVPCKGSVSGNVVRVTFSKACYAFPGQLRAVVRLTAASGNALTLADDLFQVGKGLGNEIINEDLVPSLDVLLAQIDRMEKATADAEKAATQALRNYGVLAAGTDLDTLYNDFGIYTTGYSSTYPNCPVAAGYKTIFAMGARQVVFHLNAGAVYQRYRADGVWSAWRRYDVNDMVYHGALENGTDLDTLRSEYGAYGFAYNNDYPNSPVGSGERRTLLVLGTTQVLFHMNTGDVYQRYFADGAWSRWRLDQTFRYLGSLTESDDCDDCHGMGYYITGYGNPPANCPAAKGVGVLKVWAYDNTGRDTVSNIQEYTDFNTGRMYVRRFTVSEGGWQSWKLCDLIYNSARNSETKKYVESANTEEIEENVGVDIKVCSYNIGHYNNGNSEIGMVEDVIEEKLTGLKKFLLWSNCDVYGLQEDFNYIDRAQRRGTLEYLFKPMYPHVAGTGGVTLRTKTKMWSVGLHTFTTGRTLRYARTTIKGKEILIASAHFSPNSASADVAELRKTELKELFAWIKSERPEYYVVFGDFNTGTDVDLAFFRATCEENDARIANGGYLPWQVTSKSGNALDNIIVGKNIMINEFSVLYNWYDVLYSDHAPILATLTLLG